MILNIKKHLRRSHRRCSIKKGVLRNFAKFTGKHLCQSFFLNKLQARPVTLLRKRLWHRCFLVNFAKFLRTPSLRNTFGRLLSDLYFFQKFFKLSKNLHCFLFYKNMNSGIVSDIFEKICSFFETLVFRKIILLNCRHN